MSERHNLLGEPPETLLPVDQAAAELALGFLSVLFFDLPRHLSARRDQLAGTTSEPVGAEPLA